MKFYTITEMVSNDMESFMTTNNHLKDRDEAISMFHTRRHMLLQTPGIRIIKDDYSEEYDHDWGLVKVMLENGA